LPSRAASPPRIEIGDRVLWQVECSGEGAGECLVRQSGVELLAQQAAPLARDRRAGAAQRRLVLADVEEGATEITQR
jgi:hypothetical protein